MALPWIIGGLTVATVAYLSSDDSSSSSSDKDKKEEKIRERVREEKKKKEIDKFKKNQKDYIQSKYNIQITFTLKDKVKIISEDKTTKNKISDFQNEIDALKEAIAELEVIKYETLK